MENNNYNNSDHNSSFETNREDAYAAGTGGADAYANGTDAGGADAYTNGTDAGGAHAAYTDSAANASGAADASGSGQQGSSAYGYSYIHQEHKNPNNIWRAEENTAHASGAGSTYNSAQADTGSAYSGAQADTGSAQDTAGGAYSSIYGKKAAQGGWRTYSDAKKQKKARRAEKRAGQNSGGSSNFCIKLAKCASIALVFGLVAGTAFEGSSYVAGNLLGTDREEAEAAPETGSAGTDQEVVSKAGSTVKTTEPVSASLGADSSVVPIVETCMPSIVAITNLSEVQVQNFFGQVQQYEVPSAGSGIIISEDDDYLYIATNNHVVSSATTLTVQFVDESTAGAEIKGTDPSTDLAVIQVKKADIEADALKEIKVAEFGDSDEIQVGSAAIAIGNALGYGQSVTTGVVSAVEREVTMQDESNGETYTNDLIQTDAAINPGNSGGALLNAAGQVIGINSSKYSDTDVEGMGFAIPSNTARPIIEDLIEKEEVSGEKAAFLGVYGDTVSSAVAEAYNMPQGVFIKEITKGSAADKYGLREGDIITKLDGREVKTKEALQKRISYYEAGTEVEVTIQRTAEGGYKEETVTVVLGSRNASE